MPRKNSLRMYWIFDSRPFMCKKHLYSLWRPPTASEAGQSTQNSLDMVYQFQNGATSENQTIFAISDWMVKKCLNWARICLLWATGQGRISPIENNGDLQQHFQAHCWDFFVVKIKVRDIQI